MISSLKKQMLPTLELLVCLTLSTLIDSVKIALSSVVTTERVYCNLKSVIKLKVNCYIKLGDEIIKLMANITTEEPFLR